MDKYVAVVATGGTIAMLPDDDLGGAAPALSGAALVAAVPGLDAVCGIVVREFSNVPSPFVTPQMMQALALGLEKLLADEACLGCVVTHGTDTLEETAFFLELFLRPHKPVCLTGAMRNPSEQDCDGPGNLLGAVQCAASPAAVGRGVLVVLDGHIHAAREVTKLHTTRVDSFASPFAGPLGHMEEGRPVFGRTPRRCPQPLRPQQPVTDVHLLKTVAGMDASLLDWLAERRVAGIVIEGTGCGNVPPALVPAIGRALDNGIALVLASRCPSGQVQPVYGYEGGGAGLVRMGLVPAGDISGPKARILLMLALGLTKNKEDLARLFA